MDYYDKFQGIAQQESYDEKTSLSLAIACDLAYEKEDKKIALTVEHWGYQFDGVIKIVKKPDIDTQCYVMSNADNIVVVFRGSDSLKGWFANFQAVYDAGPLNNTKAHEGFQDSLFPAVIGITHLLDNTLSQDKKIWITGHSLGGALCSLYAGMLLENEYRVYGIYTFASPRPGNRAFEEELNNKVVGPHYRVVNFSDIVPHIPPEPFYSHPGTRVILKEEMRESSEESWFSQRVEALKVFISNAYKSIDIADNHKLSADKESYIPRLLKDLKRSETEGE